MAQATPPHHDVVLNETADFEFSGEGEDIGINPCCTGENGDDDYDTNDRQDTGGAGLISYR